MATDKPSSPAKDAGDAARKAEADETKGTLKWRDVELTFDRDTSAWPIQLLAALRNDDLLGIVENALGPEQTAKLYAGTAVDPNGPKQPATRAELMDIYKAWGAEMGFPSPGE